MLNTAFFNEFTITVKTDARAMVRKLADKNVLAGVSLARLFPNVDTLSSRLLVAVTETTSEADIETLCSALKEELS